MTLRLMMIAGSAAALAASAAPAMAPAQQRGVAACDAGSQNATCRPAETSAQPIAGPFIDKDCADFHSWREAQDFFIKNGPGDPHHLDGDHDGVACEALKYRF